MKRYFILLSVSVLICPVRAQNPVFIPDANLKARVEMVLDINDPTPSDMLNLRALVVLSNLNIGDLTGLEFAANIEFLWLSNNHISDLSPLVSLTDMRSLALPANQISDLSPLSGLTRLESLFLDGNQIRNIAPLAGLTGIRYLGLARNEISDLSTLSNMMAIRQLSLDNNQIRDIGPIVNTFYLEKLWLEGNRLKKNAYNKHLPQIYAHNPGVNIWYDPPPNAISVDLSSGVGGSIVTPGEGSLQFAKGSFLSVRALADPTKHFLRWTGSAVDAGYVTNPLSATTTVKIRDNATLIANFAESLYVQNDAASDGNGSFTKPYQTLQEAVDQAAGGRIIKVLEGSYAGPPVTIDPNTRIEFEDCTLKTEIRGSGTVATTGGSELVLTDSALIDLKGTGSIDNAGTLIIQGNATLKNTSIFLADSAQVIARQGTIIRNNDIYTSEPYGLHIDAGFGGSAEDNRIHCKIFKNTLLEVRGLDQDCFTATCPADIIDLGTVPVFDVNNLAVESLEIAAGVSVSLVDCVVNHPPGPGPTRSEALYVKNLDLGAEAVLNLQGLRVYTQGDTVDAAQVIDHPIYITEDSVVNFSDPSAFFNLVTHNNTEDLTFVSYVQGVAPIPTGKMHMDTVDGLPAQAKIDMGPFKGTGITVSLSYVFGNLPDEAIIDVYLTDSNVFLEADDPRMILAGTIQPPLPGLIGTLDFPYVASFKSTVDVSALNHERGLWLELWLRDLQHASPAFQPFSHLGLLTSGTGGGSEGSGGHISRVGLAVECKGICMDMDYSTIVDVADFARAVLGAGRSVSSATPYHSPMRCVGRGFADDDCLDALDIAFWSDVFSRCPKGECTHLCGMDTGETMSLFSVGQGKTVEPTELDIQDLAGSDFLILGKIAEIETMPEDNKKFVTPSYKDVVVGYKKADDKQFNRYKSILSDPNQGCIRLVQDPQQNTYIISTVDGILTSQGTTLFEPNKGLPYPDQDQSQNQDPNFIVQIGMIDHGNHVTGWPILDAAFVDANTFYVVPVMVHEVHDPPDPNDPPFLAVAKLKREGSSIEIEQLYWDTMFRGKNDQNPNLWGLREIERDENGNIYILNVHGQNHSNILWKYDPNGQVLDRIFIQNKAPGLHDPMGLCIVDRRLYLARGQYDPNDPNDPNYPNNPNHTVVYSFSVDDFNDVNTVDVNDIQHITSMVRGPDNKIWLVGFYWEGLPEKIDIDTRALPIAYYGVMDPNNDRTVIPTKLPTRTYSIPGKHYDVKELVVPMSIVWTKSPDE